MRYLSKKGVTFSDYLIAGVLKTCLHYLRSDLFFGTLTTGIRFYLMRCQNFLSWIGERYTSLWSEGCDCWSAQHLSLGNRTIFNSLPSLPRFIETMDESFDISKLMLNVDELVSNGS